MIYHRGYIKQFHDVTGDIRVITIQMDVPYAYQAGQYMVLQIDGYDPRPFSIASAPRRDNSFDIHIRNSGQNLSQHLCHHIKQGDRVSVSMPKGVLHLQPTEKSKVFLAGGTGITPFFAIMEEVKNKPISLYWGMTSEDDFYIRPHGKGLTVRYCTDIYPVDAYIEDGIDWDAIVYLSGPPAMVADSKAKVLAAGVEPSNIVHDE